MVLICLYLLLIFNKRNNNTIIYLIFFVLCLLLMYEKAEKSVLSSCIGKNVDIQEIVIELKEKENYSNLANSPSTISSSISFFRSSTCFLSIKFSRIFNAKYTAVAGPLAVIIFSSCTTISSL